MEGLESPVSCLPALALFEVLLVVIAFSLLHCSRLSTRGESKRRWRWVWLHGAWHAIGVYGGVFALCAEWHADKCTLSQFLQ